MTELEVCSPLINLHLIWLKYSLRYMLCVTVLHYCFNYNNWQTDDKANYCRLLINMKKVLVYPNITRGCNFIALWETASCTISSPFACVWKPPCYGRQGRTPSLVLSILSGMGHRDLPSLCVFWGQYHHVLLVQRRNSDCFSCFRGIETHRRQPGWFSTTLLGLDHRGLGHYWASPLRAVEQGADVEG